MSGPPGGWRENGMARKKGPRIDRRTFLKGVGGGAASLVAPSAGATKAGEAFTAPALPSAASRADRIVYRGEQLRAVAMPLGGIGAGAIALAGDGGLRPWQGGFHGGHLAPRPRRLFFFLGEQDRGGGGARAPPPFAPFHPKPG